MSRVKSFKDPFKNHGKLKVLSQKKKYGFNIAPQEWRLEDEFPFGIAYFLGLC